MSASIETTNTELLKLIGAIVLSTQEAEMYLKVIQPFTDSADPSISAALSRADKLKKRTLGELIGKFVDSSTSISEDFTQHLANLVERRNQIVHHFHETYGQTLRAGTIQDVVDALRAQLQDMNTLRDVLAQLALGLIESMRDTTFNGTPEYRDMEELCAAFRQRIAS